MEQPYAPPLNTPICVIGSQYCPPDPTNLAVVEKVMRMTTFQSKFVVSDSNGNVLFKVKEKIWNLFHKRRVLYDAAGKPIITLRSKVFTFHNRWRVFWGDSTDSKDLIFSTKTSWYFPRKTQLYVFMASNTKEHVCDFKVEKSSFKKSSCAVYVGESSMNIAQMRKKHTFKSDLIGQDKYIATVHPNVDFAFIAALVIILHEMNYDGHTSGGSSSGI